MRLLSKTIMVGIGSLALATGSSVSLAQSTNVATNEPNNTLLDGRLLADGTLYNTLRWNLGAEYNRNNFKFETGLNWYDFFGAPIQIIRRPYENLVVNGGAIDQLFLVAVDNPIEPNIKPPYEISIRTLSIDSATVLLEDNVNFPIDLRFRSAPGQPTTARVELNDGALDAVTRAVTADSDIDLTFHSASGSNALLNMGLDPVGNSLHFQVDPGSDLTIGLASGAETRYLSPVRVDVDDATLTIQGRGAAINLEMNSDGVNGLKIINGSQMHLGGTGFSDRFEFRSNLPQDGIQVVGSSLALETATTLEGFLQLDNADVTAGASARLLGGELDTRGASTITSAGGQTHRYGNLQGTGPGTLALDGGDYTFDNLFFLVDTDLVLGTPGGSTTTDVSALATGNVPALFGKGLSGVGFFGIDNPATYARFTSGSVLSPGHSIGQLNTRGRLVLESGSTLAVEIDASLLNAAAPAANDLVVLQAAGAGQTGLFDIRAGAAMSVSLLNDTALAPGTRAVLVEYPDDTAWSGQSFAGFPDGLTVDLGLNHWLVQYNDELVAGLSPRALTLTVVDPVAVVSPTHLDFAETAGTLSPGQIVTVQNVGTDDLVITGLQRFGDAFTISGQSCIGITIAPGGNCQFTVRFFSATPGTFSGVISVQSNSFGQPPGLSLSGVATPVGGAPQATPSPAALSFSPQEIGVLSALQQVRVDNTGTAPLVVSGLQSSSGAFIVRNDGCTTVQVAPGGSCTFDVGFLPQAVGSASGTVTILSNAATATVAVTGQGIERRPPTPVPVNGALLLASLALGLLLAAARRLRRVAH
jgi:hypothetical protein